MTENDWLSETSPFKLLDFAAERLGERRSLLFGCACCRLVWHLLTDERSQRAIDVTERFANGEATRYARDVAARGARVAAREASRNFHAVARLAPTGNVDSMMAFARSLAAHAVGNLATNGFYRHLVNHTSDAFGAYRVATTSTPVRNRESICGVLRDILGSPFKSYAKQDWGGESRELAKTIDSTRAFDRLPILADALEEAGCTDAEILNHCRQPGEHCRGCWVVDLILGKS